MGKRRFTLEEIEFLGDVSPGRTRDEVAGLYSERFGSPISNWHITKILRDIGKPCGKARRYADAEIRFIKRIHLGRSYAEIASLFNERFGPPITSIHVKSFCAWHGLKTGYVHRLSKGHTLSPNSHPIGSERVKGGVVEVKVGRGIWRNRLAVLWEEANGEVPRGHVGIPADRDMYNTTPDNLLLVSLGELAVMNSKGLYSTDPEMTKTGKGVAAGLIAARKEKSTARRSYRRGNFSQEEIRFVKEMEGRAYAEIVRMFNQRFNPPVSVHHIKSLARGIWAKVPSYCPNRAIGYEKLSGGITQIKTASGKWKGKHVVLWEEANGEVPEGHCVIFANGNKQDMTIDNLLLVQKSVLMTMSVLGLHSTDPEMTKIGHMAATLIVAANKKIRETSATRPWYYRKQVTQTRRKASGEGVNDG